MQILPLHLLQKSLVLMLLVASTGTKAQPLCDSAHKHPAPNMWAPKDSTVLINFRNNKKPLLESTFKVNQPESIYLGDMLGMLDFFEKKYDKKYHCLHIYICAYTNKGNRCLSDSCINKLTLVFAPAKMRKSRKRLRDIRYYNLSDEPFDAAHFKSFKISRGTFKSWHKNFAGNFLGRLSGTVDQTSSANQEEEQHYDTRAITYCREFIHELIQEQCYIHVDSVNMERVNFSKDLMARFAAFGEKEDLLFPKRVFVEFDFMDDQHQVVSLEDMYAFGSRSTKKTDCGACQRKVRMERNGHGLRGVERIHSVDNGQLCPPSVNCPNYKPTVKADNRKR